MRIPIATIALTLTVIIVYAFLSHGTFYLPDEAVSDLAYDLQSQPSGLITHMFIHVGILHLVGNLLPLFLFGVLVELTVGPLFLLLAFFISGVVASSLYSFTAGPGFLVGASAAISGLMGAATVLKPKHALALLILTPLIVYTLAYPVAQSLSQAQEQQFSLKSQSLEKEVQTLKEQNKTLEAEQAQQELSQVKQQVEISQTGRERESLTPSAVSVHAYGAIAGVLLLFLLKRKEFFEGLNEFEHMGEQLADVFIKIHDHNKKR